ncbi:Fmp41 protein [Saccharomycopsis crataegensis]|uniref:Fmp41 protein n=1 Tax=Saccharomycopsis crataegensis TaxID=43959 RepID=A0AAV5QSP1_9ASCO|nr:Fmp41 protein [Saccharomycopsis crataegensis]
MSKPISFATLSNLKMSYSYLSRASKIVCIGRNYVAHIKELNNQRPAEPFFFLKPPSSLLTNNSGEPILIPKNVVVHHEIELAAVLNRDLKNLTMDSFSDADVLDSIEGYALALDLTARSIQDVNKAKGLPWTIAKGFDTFCPISGFIPKSKIPDPYNCMLTCNVNNELRQHDLTSLMIFNLKKILVYMSGVMTLKKGDIVLTGTPKGVGPLKPGDTIDGHITIDGKIVEESIINFKCEENPSPFVFQAPK